MSYADQLNIPLHRLCKKLAEIEQTPGKKDKLAILKGMAADPELDPIAREYFSVAMDWYRIYGLGEKALAKFDGRDFREEYDFSTTWPWFLKLIEKLENLKGTPNDELKHRIAFFLSGFEPEVRNWLRRAILKDVSIGVSEKTVNKVWPKLINFFEVQLADSCEKAEDAPLPCVLEPKLDGIRAVCRVNPGDGTVKFLSRGGQRLHNTQAAGIDDYLLSVVTEETVFDGELYTGNFNESQGITSREDVDKIDPEVVKKLRYFVFDCLTAEEWDGQKCTLPYRERRGRIAFAPMNKDGSIGGALVVKTRSHPVADPDELKRFNQMYLNLGLEGVMLKGDDGLYEFKRTKAWLKHKPVETFDFVVTGVEEGSGKHKGKAGSLVVRIDEEHECKVGSGFDDAEREEFMRNPPLGKFIEVKFKMKTPDGLLREPIFVRLRDDKKATD